MNSSPRWAEWSHLETQANSTTRHIVNKRFPITPNGVLGVAPYLLFATSVLGGTFVTSVLGGTIHKYKKIKRKEKKNNRSRTGLSLHSKRKSRYIRQDL